MEGWRFVATKDGNSGTINRADVAGRARICVLWDDELATDDLDTALDFFASLVERLGGLVLGAALGIQE